MARRSRIVTALSDPAYVELIARLRRARKSKGWTQAKLASEMGRRQSFVSKVETCERRLDVIEALRWAVALGVNLADLLPEQFRSAMEPRNRLKESDSE